jgi:hypothetical protein
LESFNPMAIRRHVAEELRSDAHFDPVPASEDNVPASEDNISASENNVPLTSPSSPNLPSPSTDPSPAVRSQQMILRFNDGPNPSLTTEPPFKKPRTGPGPETKTTRKPRRCGRCAYANCPRQYDCKGKGARHRCLCVLDDHDEAAGKRIRIAQ